MSMTRVPSFPRINSGDLQAVVDDLRSLVGDVDGMSEMWARLVERALGKIVPIAEAMCDEAVRFVEDLHECDSK